MELKKEFGVSNNFLVLFDNLNHVVGFVKECYIYGTNSTIDAVVAESV